MIFLSFFLVAPSFLLISLKSVKGMVKLWFVSNDRGRNLASCDYLGTPSLCKPVVCFDEKCYEEGKSAASTSDENHSVD